MFLFLLFLCLVINYIVNQWRKNFCWLIIYNILTDYFENHTLLDMRFYLKIVVVFNFHNNTPLVIIIQFSHINITISQFDFYLVYKLELRKTSRSRFPSRNADSAREFEWYNSGSNEKIS